MFDKKLADPKPTIGTSSDDKTPIARRNFLLGAGTAVAAEADSAFGSRAA